MKQVLLISILILLANLVLQAETPYDFDSDGKTDYGVYHTEFTDPLIGNQFWYISQSSDNSPIIQHWGHATQTDVDHLRPADFDGDGKTDFAVQRVFWDPNQPQTTFYILNSSNNTIRAEIFGRASDNSTVIGDYDGDGKADLCVYGKSGKFYGFTYKGSLNNPNGISTFVAMSNRIGLPYKGDFDGDHKLDFCIRYTQTNLPPTFTLKRSTDGGIENINWGTNTDNIAPGDYDGDGRTDFCVYRKNGSLFNWFILERDGGGTGAGLIAFGNATPPYGGAEAFGGVDFDGDHKSDVGVYVTLGGPEWIGQNPGTFYIRKSADGFLISKNWRNGPAWGDGTIYFSNISQ